MKQLFFTIALISASFFGRATDGLITTDITKSFENYFVSASSVQWSQAGHLYKATFTVDGRAMSAFYDASGELVAVTRKLSTLELPEVLRTGLKKEFHGGWVSELFVMSTKQGDTYYANLESAHANTVLQAGNNNKWTVFEKTIK